MTPLLAALLWLAQPGLLRAQEPDARGSASATYRGLGGATMTVTSSWIGDARSFSEFAGFGGSFLRLSRARGRPVLELWAHGWPGWDGYQALAGVFARPGSSFRLSHGARGTGLRYHLEARLAGYETVTVPAGVFRRCARLELSHYSFDDPSFERAPVYYAGWVVWLDFDRGAGVVRWERRRVEAAFHRSGVRLPDVTVVERWELAAPDDGQRPAGRGGSSTR